MARTKKAKTEDTAPAAVAGHNSGAPLSDEDQAALTTYYQLKIIEDQRKVDAIQVDLKAARDKVNGHFKRMTADLHFTRKEFEAEVVEKLNMTAAEYLASEAKRSRLHRLAGLKSGDQLDLITDVLGDTVDDMAAAYANGFRAGRRADDPVVPKEVAPVCHQDWLRGWHDGQAQNIMQLATAETIIAARQKPTVALQPDEPADEDAVLEAARKLAESGWTDPTPAETQFEEAAA